MQLKAIGVFGDCYEPDPTHSYNFMFDTTAINKLAERLQDIETLVKAREQLGYEYFRCRIQDGEIVGMKSDGSFHKKFSAQREKSKRMREIIETLPIRKIPSVAALVQGGIPLDGTCYLGSDSGARNEVFKKVFNENPENIEDAIIVESGIRNHCIVISNDRAMCENTNAVFPGKAMWYKRFIRETVEKIG